LVVIVFTKDFFDEFDGIKLSIFIAAGQINLTEPSNGQTIIDFVIEALLLTRFFNERVEKFCFFDHSFLQSESVVKVDVAIH
jgi:hypothetical protein